jgi:hypothetical protein
MITITIIITQPLHHSTRSSSGDLRPNLCKTSLFRNSYFNRIVFLWNNLPSDIKSSSSVAILKSKLYIFYTKKLNSTFDVHRPSTWKTVCSKCRSLHTNCLFIDVIIIVVCPNVYVYNMYSRNTYK